MPWVGFHPKRAGKRLRPGTDLGGIRGTRVPYADGCIDRCELLQAAGAVLGRGYRPAVPLPAALRQLAGDRGPVDGVHCYADELCVLALPSARHRRSATLWALSGVLRRALGGLLGSFYVTGVLRPTDALQTACNSKPPIDIGGCGDRI